MPSTSSNFPQVEKKKVTMRPASAHPAVPVPSNTDKETLRPSVSFTKISNRQPSNDSIAPASHFQEITPPDYISLEERARLCYEMFTPLMPPMPMYVNDLYNSDSGVVSAENKSEFYSSSLPPKVPSLTNRSTKSLSTGLPSDWYSPQLASGKDSLRPQTSLGIPNRATSSLDLTKPFDEAPVTNSFSGTSFSQQNTPYAVNDTGYNSRVPSVNSYSSQRSQSLLNLNDRQIPIRNVPYSSSTYTPDSRGSSGGVSYDRLRSGTLSNTENVVASNLQRPISVIGISAGPVNSNPLLPNKNMIIDQYYDLTDLKRSNVRLNDELTPRPTQVNMGPIVIDRPFPAEHPFASHQPRLAVFPKFTENPNDPRTGLVARSRQPKHAEIPSKPNDVIVVSKMYGKPYKHEVMHQPGDSQKEALRWPGDEFEQHPKSGNTTKIYYPTPPKLVSPNMSAYMECIDDLSDRSAHALHNLERDQWRTSYSRDFTGIGPANPVVLDNWEEKRYQAALNNASVDNQLNQHFISTFDPPRPVQGRISRTLDPRGMRQLPPTVGGLTRDQMNQLVPLSARELTTNGLSSREMVHSGAMSARDTNGSQHEGSNHLDNLYTNGNMFDQTSNIRPKRPASALGLVNDKDDMEKEMAIRVQKASRQQMEAENRWRLLESEGPVHDINQIRHKYDQLSHMVTQETPRIFYDHEGRFQSERAGLYRTSYLPEHMRYSLSGGETHGLTLMDTSRSHEDAIAVPTQLNRELKDLSMQNGYHNPGPTGLYPGYVGQPLDGEESASLDQRHYLQPFPHEVNPRVVEGGYTETFTEKSANFDTHKFLQEYELPETARQDPQGVLSRENGVKLNALQTIPPSMRRSRSVHFANDVTVAQMQEDQRNLRHLTSQPLNDRLISESTPYQMLSLLRPSLTRSHTEPSLKGSNGDSTRRRTSSTNGEFNGQYSGGSGRQSENSSTPRGFHLGYKDDDPRFQWMPGYGSPKPDSKLRDMQTSFDKSQIRRIFHSSFPEGQPDLRENFVKGKRHNIQGFNSHFLHG